MSVCSQEYHVFVTVLGYCLPYVCTDIKWNSPFPNATIVKVRGKISNRKLRHLDYFPKSNLISSSLIFCRLMRLITAHMMTVQFLDMKILLQEFYEICLRCFISSSAVQWVSSNDGKRYPDAYVEAQKRIFYDI